MFKSIRTAITFTIIVFLLFLIFFIFSYSSINLKRIITTEKSLDFNERLRLVVDELMQTASDIESSGMSMFLSSFQEETIENLRSKYYLENLEESTAFPFIFSANGEVVMHPTMDSGASLEQEEFFHLILEMGQGESDFNWNGEDYYFVFRNFEDWEWYIVYVISVKEKYRSVDEFISKLMIALFLSLFVAVIIIYLILTPILKPLKVVSTRIQAIAQGEGDLTSRMNSHGKNEISVLSAGFNTFVGKLHEIILTIKDQNGSLSNNCDELANHSYETWTSMEEIVQTLESIREQADRMIEFIDSSQVKLNEVVESINKLEKEGEVQSTALVESSSAIEEMVSSIENVTRITNKRQQDSQNMIKATNEGNQRMKEVLSIISSIIVKMSQMQEVVSVINHINQQLNLLSMNAAIEAAHAGDSGKGFGVVAEEIRKLSEGTADNARNIDNLISSVVTEMHSLEGIGKSSSESFVTIDKEVNTFYDALNEVNHSMQEMNVGSKEVITALKDLKEISSLISSTTYNTREVSSSVKSSYVVMADISKGVDNAVQEIVRSANQVNEAMGNVNSLVEKSQSSTQRITTTLEKFKT